MKLKRKYIIRRVKVFKQYAKEASEMTREKLEHAYIRCQFARTVFNEVNPNVWLDFLEDEEEQ